MATDAGIIRPRRGDLEAATQPHPFRSSGEYVGPARVEVCDLCGLAQRGSRIHPEAMPTKRCEVCRRDVPINEWDYGVCGSCRRLATGDDD